MLVSNFGLVFAPDHANVASELARVARPGGRLGFTAWKPNSKLGELYRRFTEEPIEGREAYEWGREDHVEDMLGEDFELEFEDGTLWLEAESGEEIWKLFSESAPPVVALLQRLDPAQQEEFHHAFVRAVRGLPGRKAKAGCARRAATCSSSASESERCGAGDGGEVVGLLQELIRLDTTNPPGNETLAAELLRDYLEAAGVECALYARTPERANLVARIRGRGDGPSLALLSHTDVVLADAREWEREPFGGELVDGEVWGRGALDMKGEVAASAVALATLAREGWRGSGDLIFIAAADEEVGDGFGLEWLVEAHPDAVRADFSLNEGAGDRVELGGKVLYLCSTAEKMSSPFLLRVHGRSGHASMPSIADNALVKAAPLVARLGELSVEPQLIPEVEGFLTALLGSVPPVSEALSAARAVAPLAGELIEPLLGMTVSPTRAHASDKRNVIPALCEITIDIRLLPGQTPADAEAVLRDVRSARATTSSSTSRRRAARARRSAGRSGRPCSRSSRRRSRARPPRRSASRGSRTRTGCARPSAPSPTASSPRVRWTPRPRLG